MIGQLIDSLNKDFLLSLDELLFEFRAGLCMRNNFSFKSSVEGGDDDVIFLGGGSYIMLEKHSWAKGTSDCIV